MTPERYQYLKKYEEHNRLRLSLNLSKETEKDIIEAILAEGKGNKQAGIKKLIRKGIKYNEEAKCYKESPLPC